MSARRLFFSRRRLLGFSLTELMVSVTILAVISTITVFTLSRTRQTEELRNAARVLAADIRSVQAQALAGGNVRVCGTVLGDMRLCTAASSTGAVCMSRCLNLPASDYGMMLTANASSYSLFADVTVEDWRESLGEQVQQRNVSPLPSSGVAPVSIRRLGTPGGDLAIATIGVGRQNGRMRVNACGDVGLPVCVVPEPDILTIELFHVVSGETATVSVDTRTGRVSLLE